MMAVRVYASRARADTYLYVPAEPDLARVPEPLLAQLQPLRNALELELHEQSRLAQADAATVLQQLHSAGFYLQLPPAAEAGDER